MLFSLYAFNSRLKIS